MNAVVPTPVQIFETLGYVAATDIPVAFEVGGDGHHTLGKPFCAAADG